MLEHYCYTDLLDCRLLTCCLVPQRDKSQCDLDVLHTSRSHTHIFHQNITARAGLAGTRVHSPTLRGTVQTERWVTCVMLDIIFTIVAT